jgi:hypothetical protein
VNAHNAGDMAKLPGLLDSGNEEEGKLYFILRDPYERFVAEFLHYSNRLDAVGQVNHLKKEEISIDYKDPFQYAGMEVNRNVMCKFLSRSLDFSATFPSGNVEKLVNIVKSGKAVFDVFSRPMKYAVFAEAIDSAIPELPTLPQQYAYSYEGQREVMLKNDLLREHHRKLNASDYALYDILSLTSFNFV